MFSASLKLQEMLLGSGFAARAAMGTAALGAAATADLVLLYTALGAFPARLQTALADAVAGGTGMIAVHSASVFPRSGDGGVAASHHLAAQLIGARYLSHGPAPHQSRFQVLTDQQHPITRGLAPFEVTAEHYELAVSPDAQVVAWREVPAGAPGDEDHLPPAREPVCSVRTQGRGRVCYLQLGHDMRVWDEPAVRDLIVRAAAWARRQTRTPEAR